MIGRVYFRKLGWSALLALCLPVPAQAAIIVLRVEGPPVSGLTPGKALAPGKPVKLAEGNALTLVDRAGTRILRGPGEWTLGPVVRGAPSTLQNLVQKLDLLSIDERSIRAAAVRAGPETDPGVFEPQRLLKALKVDAEGHYCVWGRSVTFEKDKLKPKGDYTVLLKGAGGERTLAFGNQRLADAPVDFLTRGSGAIELVEGGATRRARFTRIGVPKTLEDLAAAASRAGCEATMAAIVETTPAR